MASKNKSEQVFIGIDDQVIELTGADLEAFIADREARQLEAQARQAKAQAELELKKSAYAKLGLTEEEINAIL
jgi:hypothetical protein